MEIILNKTDELSANIIIKITEPDYNERVEKSLRDIRRKVDIKGFRKGNVPFSLVKKMYGKGALADELNKIISESLYNYISENKLNILGDPLPRPGEKGNNIETDNEFEFNFEVALSPEFEVKLSKRDKAIKTEVEPSEQEIEEYKNYYLKRFGVYADSETITEDSLVKVFFYEKNEDGSKNTEGFTVDETEFMWNHLLDEAKSKISELTIDSETDINPLEIFKKENIHLILHTEKDDYENIPKCLTMKIASISTFSPAEINQDFFEKAFANENITSEEEFNAKIIEEIKNMTEGRSLVMLHEELKNKLLKKTDINLPEDFLKEWILTSNEEAKPDKLEEEFPVFVKEMKWQLIKNKIIKDNNINITEEEIKEDAFEFAKGYFYQYGMYQPTYENIKSIADSILSNEDQRKNIVSNVYSKKVFSFIKESINLDVKNVSLEEFKNLK